MWWMASLRRNKSGVCNMASKEERDYLAQYIDISNARLSDNDVSLLNDFINNIGSHFERTTSYDGWSSDGRYTRTATNEYIIESDYTITHNYSYNDDDGQGGSYSTSYSEARDIINILKAVPELL